MKGWGNMTFREFHLRIMRDEVLGRLLPLELRRTYPRFRLKDVDLLAAFVGFRVMPEINSVKISPPAYFLEITYPQCAVWSFEMFPSKIGTETAGEMTPHKPEDIKRLAELCDNVLRLFDEKDDGLQSVLSEYDALLRELLEPEQVAVLEHCTRE